MKEKKKVPLVVFIVFALVAIFVVVALILIFRKPEGVTFKKVVPVETTTQDTKTEQVGAVDMVKAFQGLSVEELQSAYDECVKHPEINKEDFDCEVIQNLIKSKK